MFVHLRMVWVQVRDSLWFLPGLLTLAAAVLAFSLVAAERSGVFPTSLETHWLFEGGVEGARGVLSTIAGGLITVTGVVFSVTIVALQLASSQFTPRVLRNFTADRATQVVLGVFVATFTYVLIVLRTVHGATNDQETFIPRIAVAVAMTLVLVSIGFLIFFINHAARSIQISTIINRITQAALHDVQRLFPEQVGQPDDAAATAEALMSGASDVVRTKTSGYLQAVDAAALFEAGARGNVLLRMEPKVGTFVLSGEALVTVWPAGAVNEELARQVRKAFVVGTERTPEQDLEFALVELADIAVKALSPSINDPTTAMRCIDRLGEILLALARRDPPRVQRTKEGHVHFIGRYTRFEEALSLAYDQIHHFGVDNAVVMTRLVNMLVRLEALAPADRQPPIRQMRVAVAASADITMREAANEHLSGAHSA